MKNKYLLLLLFFSCGLEEVGYLENPTINPVPSLQLYQLEGRLIWDIPKKYFDDNSSFEGFDLYYKIQSPSDGQNILTDNTALLTAEPPSSTSKLKNQLLYTPISQGQYEQRSPHILITDKTKGYKFSIDFSAYQLNLSEERPNIIPAVKIFDYSTDMSDVSSVPLSQIPIYRGVRINDKNEYKSFGLLFDVDKSREAPLEIPTATGNGITTEKLLTDNNLIEISFYIVSLGFDTNTFETLESTPVPIGTIKELKIR